MTDLTALLNTMNTVWDAAVPKEDAQLYPIRANLITSVLTFKRVSDAAASTSPAPAHTVYNSISPTDASGDSSGVGSTTTADERTAADDHKGDLIIIIPAKCTWAEVAQKPDKYRALHKAIHAINLANLPLLPYGSNLIPQLPYFFGDEEEVVGPVMEEWFSILSSEVLSLAAVSEDEWSRFALKFRDGILPVY